MMPPDTENRKQGGCYRSMKIRSNSRFGKILLILTLMITACCLWEPAQTSVDAARSRSRSARSQRGKRKHGRRSRLRRGVVKRRVPARSSLRAPSPGSYPIAPDRIEVIEHSASETASNHLVPTLQPTAQQMAQRMVMTPADPNNSSQADSTPISFSRRRINVRIDSERVTQIQMALQKRGMYTGEPTGVYDEETISAMTRFQQSVNIPATGYPTAHALNRLGLAR